MQKFVKDYLNELTRQKKRRREVAIAVVLLAVLVIGGVAGILEQYGIAMTGQAVCGIEEHKHNDACYKETLICGQEAGKSHSHEAACYETETVLTCEQEESGHTHDDSCCETITDSALICSQEEGEEHTHGEECYDSESETVFICGQEEGGHTHEDACYTEKETLVCEAKEDSHTHSDACYEETLTCEKEEHQHTDDCYGNSQEEPKQQPQVFEEDPGEWEEQYAEVHWTDDWGKDLVTAAKKQLGYEEKVVILEDGSEKIYTRYGHFADDKYLENWDAAFVNFCMYYAGLEDAEVFVDETDAAEWYSEFEREREENKDYLTSKEDYTPEAGDLVFLQEDGEEQQMGIVSSYNNETGKVEVIQGNSEGKVEENTYDEADDAIDSYLKVSKLEDDCKNEDDAAGGEPAEDEEDITSQQVEAVIALIEALPTPEEVMEKFTAFQDAEDEEGYNAYYMELYEQVLEAKKAYDALSEEQKQAVTNGEKLQQFEWLWTDTMDTDGVMGPDEAYVNKIEILGMRTGTAPWDDAEGRGNDTTESDGIVRTYDAVTYDFSVNMVSWDSTKTFKEARVKLEFVLPLAEEQAVFDQSAMAWMDQTEGYAPKLTTETRTIDGVEKECQVLTCYKLLKTAVGNKSVVPGDFGENLTIYVKSMHNGESFTPIISAAMEGGAWGIECENEKHKDVEERKTVVPDPVTVTAAPKYNIQLDSEVSYREIFDFQGDAEWMEKYGNIAANTDIQAPMPGRLMKVGITLQLYNDNKAKGLKGIELPEGPISFDLNVSSAYTPTGTSEEGIQQDTTADYTPLLWSYGENREIKYAESNTDGRVLYDQNGCLELAPYFEHDANREGSDCQDSGKWAAVQEGTTIHITVSDYTIDLEHMPTKNFPVGKDQYEANVGCFSAGGIWLVQPFNKKNSGTAAEGPKYDIIEELGPGAFATKVEANNLKTNTASGETVIQGQDGFDQMVKTDDEEAQTLELNLPGSMQNRVRYSGDRNHWWLGSGVDSTTDGKDYASVGGDLHLVGGFSYGSNKDANNQLYLGTNLIRFYGSAIELYGEGATKLTDGASLDGKNGPGMDEWWMKDETKSNIRIYYATKKDGTDWKDDEELKHTYEKDLDFYESLEEIPKDKICVGILTCFVGPGPDPVSEKDDGYYYYYHYAKVRDDQELVKKSFALVSTSRVWTKEMFEDAGKDLSDIGLGTPGEVNIQNWLIETGMLENWHYKSANIEGSVWYNRETYKEDGSGILATHNSDYEHWGDTLLIIGYKTSVTKNLLQMVNGEEKKIFNLDAGQRTADFKLQPRTYYEKEGDYDYTAPVTVVDNLPEHMTYKPGSAYFGGKYEQTAEDGGSKGNIIRDEGAAFPEPISTEPAITRNEDGTQTLTWVIENVKIGEPMAPIFYSVDIGNVGNPDKDVSTGTTDLENTAYITAPGDLRDPLKTAEKHSKAGISVTRGTASSFGKYTEQKVVEADDEINYVVYFNNNANTQTELLIMDTMPMNGANGSEFTGTYTLDTWKLDVSKCDVGKLKIYYTFEEQYKDKGIKDVDRAEIETWPEASIDISDGTISMAASDEGKGHPVAWIVAGTLDQKKSVYIDLKIKLDPEAMEAEKEKPNYFVNLLSNGDTTTTTENPTAKRTLEGLTWLDYNRDGVRDHNAEAEPWISGVQVELLRLKEGGDPSQEDSYENVCYPETNTPITVQTGKQISVNAKDETDAVDYEPGRYKFLDLPEGTFAVRFTDGTLRKITELNATKSNQGDDKTDSDGIPVYDTDGRLRKTVILNLNMPKAAEMETALYESKHNDSGFYPDTLMKVRKVDAEKNKSLAGAVFTIQNAEGTLLSFTNVQGEGYYLEGYGKAGSDSEEAELITNLTVDNSGKLNIYNLLPGTYTITEIEAPDGYTLLKEPVSFTLKMNGTDSFIELSTPDGNNGLVSVEAEDEKAVVLKVQNEKLYELPKTGGTGTFVYTISGTLLMLAAALILYKKKEFIKSRQSL